MTKLLEWLGALSAVFAVWVSLLTGYIKHPLLEQNRLLVILSPFIFAILFALYAVSLILYRVYAINECDEANKELQEQILEAKKDLRSKGLKL